MRTILVALLISAFSAVAVAAPLEDDFSQVTRCKREITGEITCTTTPY